MKNPKRFFRPLIRSRIFHVTGLFFASLVLRWAYTLIKSVEPLRGDVQFYDKLAVLFANKFLGTSLIPFFPEARLIPYEHLALVRPPLYPAFLGTVYALFDHSLTIASLANGVLSAATVVMVYLLASELFGGTAGLIAGLYAVFYPPFIYLANVAYPETLYALCTIITILIIVWFDRKNSLLLLVLAGLAAGLAVNARPNFLAVIPVLVTIIWLYQTGSKLRKAFTTGLFLAILTATLIPRTAYNYYVHKIPAPVDLTSGLLLYLGNNPTSTVNDYSTDDRIITCREAESMGNDAAIDAYLRSKATSYIIKNPWRTVRLWAARFFFFFHFDPALRQTDFKPLNDTFKWVNLSFYGPVLLFWLIGPLVLRERRRLPVLYLTVVTFAATSVVFPVRVRYRLPVEPLMIVVAAGTTWYFLTRLLKNHR